MCQLGNKGTQGSPAELLSNKNTNKVVRQKKTLGELGDYTC